MTTVTIGIIGDFDQGNVTHRATSEAIHQASDLLNVTPSITWLPTEELEINADESVAGFDAVWSAPGGPYRSMRGALEAIRSARTADKPFIGTCGGFQHVIIEYARNVIGIVNAQHAEYDPYASNLFITPLTCSLVGKTMQISIVTGSHAFEAYGCGSANEHYYCNFGLNPACRSQLQEGGLQIVGLDQDGEA